MSVRNLAVVTAGLTNPSSTRLLADRLTEAVAPRVPVEPHVVELRDHARDVADNFVTGFAPPALAEQLDAVSKADGLIAVTPIFTASFSGLFKSFFDVLDNTALRGKPVLTGATGGTPRHSLALEHAVRPMFAYLRAIVMPTGVYAASQDWGGEGAAELSQRIDRAAGELADALNGRTAAAEPEEEFVPFDELLRRQGR
ncbi:FMN reductase [Saccharomonospora xinjiangensis]|uniref:FMN reductase n=1 Tax=Saccharomonospora xinjiangensis TaxID=75294 RepID=UPI00106FB4E9|nr:FMN reductase [Saccharomonospora xinjiangensis]QBQ61725.1 FMN reductase (NADPH) [Saccharomonospora xinjiangensis]